MVALVTRKPALTSLKSTDKHVDYAEVYYNCGKKTFFDILYVDVG